MPSVPQTISFIADRTGVPHYIVWQVARSLREHGLLPTARGRASALVDSEHVALIIIGSLVSTTAKSATDRTVEFASLLYEGDGADPTTLLGHLSAIIESVWHERGSPRYPFVELRLDLTAPGAVTKMNAPTGQVLTSTFVKPGADVAAFTDAKLRFEAVLSAEAFYNIIGDLRANNRVEHKVVPFRLRRAGGR